MQCSASGRCAGAAAGVAGNIDVCWVHYIWSASGGGYDHICAPLGGGYFSTPSFPDSLAFSVRCGPIRGIIHTCVFLLLCVDYYAALYY